MTIDELVERFAGGDEEARTQLELLGERAAPAVPALCAALRGGSAARRVEALAVLERIGPAARDAVPAVGELLADDDEETVAAAADVLAAVGPDALGVLEGLLGHRDARVRRAACLALGGMGTAAAPAVAPLLRRLDDPAGEVSERALWALGRIGAREALQPLVDLFPRAAGESALQWTEVLAQLGTRSGEAAAALRERLAASDPDQALAAARALLRLRTHQEAAVWVLITLLGHRDRDVRLEAAVALGDGGRACRGAIPALREARTADDEELRSWAAAALIQIAPERQ